MPNPAPFMSFNHHIDLLHIRHFQQIHIRYSIGPINVKNPSEARVHKDLKFGGNWFGDSPSAWTIQQNWYDIASKNANFKAVWKWTISPNWWQYSKGSLAFLNLQSTSASLPKYVNWFASSTGCPFRTIALGRVCLVVYEFTILMDLVFQYLDLNKRSCPIFKWIKHVCCIKDTIREQADIIGVLYIHTYLARHLYIELGLAIVFSKLWSV